MDNIVVDNDKCFYCGRCVDACILDNLCLQVAPCQANCPLHQNAHGYVQLIARGKFKEALDEITKTLPFPEIIGRICSRPCEEACARARADQTIAIRHLKRFAAEQARSERASIKIEKERDERVAVVGSGPAGMMAAYDLRCLGYQVTVYEAEAHPGGMLIQAIPDYRLPKEIVSREFGLLADMGVQIQCGMPVGERISLEEILERYQAAFIATGTHRSLSLTIQGESMDGVYAGLAFLKEVKSGLRPFVGHRTAVIGGGNTAIDAARTALRLGARQVHLISLEGQDDMPAFPWDLDEARKEGVIFEPGWGPGAIRGDGGKARLLELKRCLSVFNQRGEFQPRYDESEIKALEVDAVIVAIGHEGEAGFLGSHVELDPQQRPMVDPLSLQTSHPKIFAGGDAVTGPTSAVHAMRQGRDAAISIDRYLNGEELLWGRGYFNTSLETDFLIDTHGVDTIPQVPIVTNLREQPGDFGQIDERYTAEQAMEEAKRCLSCGVPYGKYETCWYCLPCEIECPVDALKVELPYLVR